MSRTKRRTRNSGRDMWWVLRDWDFSEPEFNVGRLIQIDPRSKEGKKRLAKYHADAGSTMLSGPPGWYCNLFEREARTEAKRQIHCYLRNPEDLANNRGFMVMIDPKHHHNARWSWW